MSFATKMYLSIIAILVAVILGVCLAWQHAKNVASEAEHKLELSEVKALTQKERETRLLEKLNSEHAEEIAEMAMNALKVEQDYKEQLNEIKLRVTTANSVNERLRDQIRILNGKLSELPRETVEHYATTSADNLSQCSTTTGELEQIALRYYTDYKRLYDLWPTKQADGSIKVVDGETELIETFTYPIKIKGTIKDISPVVP